jgi:hypothetical protein
MVVVILDGLPRVGFVWLCSSDCVFRSTMRAAWCYCIGAPRHGCTAAIGWRLCSEYLLTLILFLFKTIIPVAVFVPGRLYYGTFYVSFCFCFHQTRLTHCHSDNILSIKILQNICRYRYVVTRSEFVNNLNPEFGTECSTHEQQTKTSCAILVAFEVVGNVGKTRLIVSEPYKDSPGSGTMGQITLRVRCQNADSRPLVLGTTIAAISGTRFQERSAVLSALINRCPTHGQSIFQHPSG